MPELIDVLDENGVKTGRVVTREEVHREGLWHQIAVVVVLDGNDRILLQQRSSNKQTNPGKWDIAGAGHVDAGESSLTAAKREVEEEIGIVANDLDFLLSYVKESEYKWRGERMMDKQRFDCFVLRVPKIRIDDLRLQSSEVQEVRLCTLAELFDLLNSKKMVNREPLYEAIAKLMERGR